MNIPFNQLWPRITKKKPFKGISSLAKLASFHTICYTCTRSVGVQVMNFNGFNELMAPFPMQNFCFETGKKSKGAISGEYTDSALTHVSCFHNRCWASLLFFWYQHDHFQAIFINIFNVIVINWDEWTTRATQILMSIWTPLKHFCVSLEKTN